MKRLVRTTETFLNVGGLNDYYVLANGGNLPDPALTRAAAGVYGMPEYHFGTGNQDTVDHAVYNNLPGGDGTSQAAHTDGDYDGDGYSDLALYRPDCTNGSSWWVKSTHTGVQLNGGTNYGGCHDIPAPGDYDGDGKTDVALYRQDCTNGSTWWVKSSRTGTQLYGGTKYGGCHDLPAVS